MPTAVTTPANEGDESFSVTLTSAVNGDDRSGGDEGDHSL